MSYQMKYVYNDELDNDVLDIPLLSIYTRNRFSDVGPIINMKGVNVRGKHYNTIR